MHPDIEARQLEALQAHARTLGHDLTPLYYETYDPMVDAGRVACCLSCGHRIAWGSHATSSGPLARPCKPDPARAVESQAWLTGCVPRLLLARFVAAVESLAPEVQRSFAPGDFDASNLSLLSDDGVWLLEWSRRYDPGLPVAADNPQHPGGHVELTRRVFEDEIRAARYTGPRYNPNIGTDPAHYIWPPLETGTRGFAYQDGDARWRFRPLDAVFAYYVPAPAFAFETDPPAAPNSAGGSTIRRNARATSDFHGPPLPSSVRVSVDVWVPGEWEEPRHSSSNERAPLAHKGRLV